MASLTTDLPDYMTDPNAVLCDNAEWRYGKAPDYTKTRKFFAESKHCNHQAGSLPQLVENLVKNWEIEASFKPRLADWRTIDHSKYTFAVNGLTPISGEDFLRLGTYNATIAPCEYYDSGHCNWTSSHKTFKRMIPTFAWEVIEVYSGPPVVAFKWRHWGEMKNDYVGWNVDGNKVTIKGNGRNIDIEGVTIAYLNEKLQIAKLTTWFDSTLLFRQIDPDRQVIREPDVKEAQNLLQSCPVLSTQGTPSEQDGKPE
ncbi:hypothetical protein F4810DRAFT_718895 [Camillea tinctor]|nr:hypothetical protein F4810DRAFT_718895 [Camillea tinctor]